MCALFTLQRQRWRAKATSKRWAELQGPLATWWSTATPPSAIVRRYRLLNIKESCNSDVGRYIYRMRKVVKKEMRESRKRKQPKTTSYTKAWKTKCKGKSVQEQAETTTMHNKMRSSHLFSKRTQRKLDHPCVLSINQGWNLIFT